MATIIIIGVLGALIGIVIGMFWYSDKTPMGKWHMASVGFDKLSPEERARVIAEAKPRMWKQFSAQALLSFITAFFIGAVTSFSVQNGAPASSVFFYIPAIWLAFTVPTIGQNILWGSTKGALAWKRFFSDSISNLITYLLVAFVATLFF
ncbi:MAG: DUF1761 family protein [Candidatus Paceibacteria bacterium]